MPSPSRNRKVSKLAPVHDRKMPAEMLEGYLLEVGKRTLPCKDKAEEIARDGLRIFRARKKRR